MCVFAEILMSYHELRKKSLLVTKEPLAGADLKTIFWLLKQNKFHVSIPYFPRFIYTLLLSTVLSPFRYKDKRFMKRNMDEITLHPSPLFLLGHWRGGTTYLHNMLCKDDQFGFFSTFDAYVPGVCIQSESLLKGIVAGSLPKTRPMDDVVMGADLPQEEEYALGGLSVYSYYHGWCFPRNMNQYDCYVGLDDVSKKEVNDFKKTYLYLLKKASFKNNNRRLVLKNPSNTARVKLLLELFPNAKFVHIHRNPFHQYLSMVRFMQTVIPLYCLQTPPPFEDAEKHIFGMYKQMYKKYLREKKLIPKGNLIEVKYENFVSDPMSELKRIYEELQLPGYISVEKRFYAYMLAQSEIHPHEYLISDEIREKVLSHWAFAFDAFGYDKEK
jgi:hypothetical protein